ncbi:MAG TPA: S41 family peptidase, partial [Chloroflexota bacterium]|nr:S41 family peptidase [Chloroflexota bacterium]
HTYFVDPQERNISETQLQGGFEGIGVTVEMTKDGKVRVVAPQEGSPGEKAGIQPGDLITHVDGKSLAGLTLTQAVSLIRGPKDTTVTLTIARENAPDPLTFEIARAEIRVESVRAEMLDQNVAYIRISQFGTQTSGELKTALQQLLDQNPQGLILDLRANPGGYLVAAVDVASQFLKDGIVLVEERSGGERQAYRVKQGGIATDIKMVILVDKGSASASEIVAGALQDYERATLIGTTTYGKGSMQSVHTLSDGSSIHVTIAHWLTPKERPINGNGLVPDVEVQYPNDPVAEGDPQLDKAIEVLVGQ